jgi:hypothetical protein
MKLTPSTHAARQQRTPFTKVVFGFFVFAAFHLLAGGQSTMAVEEPSYEKLVEYEEFELRKYPSLIVAETVVENEFDDAGTAAFKRLGGYIFGANQSNDKIDMTAPVSTEPMGEIDGKKRWKVHFVMPAGKTMTNLPVPNDATVIRKEIPEQIVAVHRFSGRWSEERFKEKTDFLIEQVKQQGLVPKIGTARYARYNPPYVPWFLRRNEVMVEIDFKTVSAPVRESPALQPSRQSAKPSANQAAKKPKSKK